VTGARALDRFDVPGRWIVVWLLVAYTGVVALHLASGLDVEAWDDAYFFKRIGLNILQHGSAAWNLREGPVYGNTSQGFQVVTLLPLLFGADYYISIMKFVSALAMVLTLVLYLRAARRSGDLAFAAGVAFLGACGPFLLLLIHSGMETNTSFVVLAINLLVIHDSAGRTRRQQVVAVVITTLLVYLTRPDAVAISLVTIAVHSTLGERKPDWRLLGCCLAGLLAVLAVCYLYFGSPFPLAFYLKSRPLTAYATQFVDLDLVPKRRNLVGLLVMAAPLVHVAAHGRSAWSRALLAAAAVFVAYHYFFTVEVMGYYARFYVPAMVPVTLAAIDAAPRWRERSHALLTLAFVVVYGAVLLLLYRHRLVYDAKDPMHMRVDRALYLGYAIAASVLLLGAHVQASWAAILVALPLAVGSVRGLPLPPLVVHDDATLLAKHIERFTTVRGILAVRACIPPPFRMYHTEIGIPGVLFPSATITDMAGLMDKEFARAGMSFDARCEKDRPELIFLPHRNYKVQRDRILNGTCIRDYQLVVSNSSSPLYVRKDLAGDFVACAHRMGDRWVDGAPQP